MEKLHVSAYSGHLQVLKIFLLKEFYIIHNLHNIDIPPIQLNNSTQNDDEISTSPRGLGILYITLLAKKCQNLKMTAIGRNMCFFLANKHQHLAIFYSCVF